MESERGLDVKHRIVNCVASVVALSVSVVAAAEFTVNEPKELEHVCYKVRKLREKSPDEEVVIRFAPGQYVFEKGVNISDGSFGAREGGPKTILDGGGKAVLKSGHVITGWTKTTFNGRNDVWVADVPDAVKTRQRLFFRNGRRQELCRYPNADPKRPYSGGFAYVAGTPIGMFKKRDNDFGDRMELKPEDFRAWKNPSEGLICIFPRYNWWNKMMPIKEIVETSPTNRVLFFTEMIARGSATNDFYTRPNDRYYALGLAEELDAPGEWYHDLEGRKIYYIPDDGRDPNLSHTAVATGTTIFSLHNCHGFVIRGFEICEADKGIASWNSRDCAVIDCRLHDIGFWGDAIGFWTCRNVRISDCDIWDIGGYGIQVSDDFKGTYTTADRANIVVDNNYIHHVGRNNRHGFGILISGQGITVSHNLIHDVPRGGIFYSGRFNAIVRNRIRHCNTEMEDTAAIYGGGFMSNTGTKINGNHVSHSIGFSHDAQGRYSFFKTCAWGIYLDDCSGGAEVVGNLMEHCNGGGMHMHCARYNVVSNNVFVSNGGRSSNPRQTSWGGWTTNDVRWMEYLRRHTNSYNRLVAADPSWTNYPAMARSPANIETEDGFLMLGNRLTHNVFYYPDQTNSIVVSPRNFHAKRNLFDFNVFWSGGAQPTYSTNVHRNYAKFGLDEWQSVLGQERHGLVADPLFVDPAHGDYHLRGDSPARKLGIWSIAFEKCGLYLNEVRRALPKEAEGLREHPEWLTE